MDSPHSQNTLGIHIEPSDLKPPLKRPSSAELALHDIETVQCN